MSRWLNSSIFKAGIYITIWLTAENLVLYLAGHSACRFVYALICAWWAALYLSQLFLLSSVRAGFWVFSFSVVSYFLSYFSEWKIFPYYRTRHDSFAPDFHGVIFSGLLLLSPMIISWAVSKFEIWYKRRNLSTS